MEGSRRVVQALLGVQITLAGIALALISSGAGAVVLFLVLARFAVTGSALPGRVRAPERDG
jgi:hypothetical protein